MKRIASTLGLMVLIAASTPTTAQVAVAPPPPPVVEPCLQDPPYDPSAPRPTVDPANPRYWFDCTSEQAQAAIRRHCDRVETPRTMDHLMCINDWSAQDLSRRRQPPPVDPVEVARTACRGQIHRRIGESRANCEARLIASGDALRPPAVARSPAPPRETCTREALVNDEADGVRFRFNCTTVTER